LIDIRRKILEVFTLTFIEFQYKYSNTFFQLFMQFIHGKQIYNNFISRFEIIYFFLQNQYQFSTKNTFIYVKTKYLKTFLSFSCME